MCKITKENDSLQRQTENKDEDSHVPPIKKNVPELRFPEFEGEWKEVQIKDIANIVGGGTPSTKNKDFWNGKINWFTPTEVGENKYLFNSERKITEKGLEKSSATLLPINTILLTTRATIGRRSIILKKSTTNQGFQSLTIKNNSNVEFIYYLLDTLEKILLRKSCGSTFLELSKKELKKINIIIPIIEEQEKIANFLSAIDKKIGFMEKTLKQNIKEKTYYLQNLFPNENKIPLIRFSEFNDNWQIRKIKEVLNISGRIGFRGYTQKDFVKKGEGALTIGAKHITSNNKLKLVEPEYISWNKYYESPEIMIQKGDILLSKTGTIGKVTLINKEIGEATINPNLVLLNDFKADRKFLYYLMSTYNFKKELLRYSTTTSVPMINQENINNISIKIPSHDEQIRIVKVLTTIDRKIDLNNKKLNHLKQLKKGLLQKMFC